MNEYSFLNIPASCFVGSTVYKKLFYENEDLGSRDKTLFAENINKITWVYSLKPDTINIAPYKDEMRDYPEVVVIGADINKDYGIKRMAEIIMRSIPYPMLLIFNWDERMKFYVAHQRISQSDSSKNTIEDFISTGWIASDSGLFDRLDIRKMRFTNYFTLYSDLVDAISIYNVSDIIPEETPITGPEARKLTEELEGIEGEISALRSKLKNETQFNRKMELNIKIKNLERDKNRLLGGYVQ